MDNQEAKFILKAYRPGGADAGDPVFAEALAQAQRDPALGDWLAREQSFDRAVADKLAQITLPPDLRQAILAGARVSATPSNGWRQPRWLAIAASFALLFGVGFFTLRYFRAEERTRFAAFAIADLLHGHHGGHGEAAQQVQTVMTGPSAKLTGGLPVDFEVLRSTGCRTLTFRGRDVLEICLHRASGVVHLYVMRRGDLPMPDGAPQVAEKHGLALASWSDERHTYFAATTDGRAVLEQFL